MNVASDNASQDALECPPPLLGQVFWVTWKGFAASVWAAWVAALCLNSFQPLVETVPALEHEGGALGVLSHQDIKGRGCDLASLASALSLKGHDQS